MKVSAARYVLDTSSWVRIDERPDSNRVWNIIEPLIPSGAIVTTPEVWVELENNEGIIHKLKVYREELVLNLSSDVRYLLLVGEITREFPAMAGARSSKNKADPYVIAHAEYLGLTVVAEETPAKRPSRKIPGACAARKKALCIDLIDLLRREDPHGGW